MTTETLQRHFCEIHYYGESLHRILTSAIDAEARNLGKDTEHPAAGNTPEANITFLERVQALLKGTEQEREAFIFFAAEQLEKETIKTFEYWETQLLRILKLLRDQGGLQIVEKELKTARAQIEP